MSLVQPSRSTRQRPDWVLAGLVTLGFVALLWLIELVDSVDGGRLDQYGVRPHSESGLLGIVFAPVLHASWSHLEGNTVPVLVLGFLVLASDLVRGLAVTLVIWLVAGVGVWLFAPSGTLHLGASSLVFGWMVFLILRGFVTGRPGQIILGVSLLLLYGGLLLGVLPGQPGVSWQGHLFGATGGALAAYRFAGRRDPDAARYGRVS